MISDEDVGTVINVVTTGAFLVSSPLRTVGRALSSTRHALQQEVSSSRPWNSLMLESSLFLLCTPTPPGRSLRLHLETSQPWPSFPASFAGYSFSFVQMVAGGGGRAVRSSYSQKGRSMPEKYYHSKHMRSKEWESFGVPDYICQGNETEQKLSNIKLFKCIPRVLNAALFLAANNLRGLYFSLCEKTGKNVPSKMRAWTAPAPTAQRGLHDHTAQNWQFHI